MLDLHTIPKEIADLRRLADGYGVTLPPSLVGVLDACVNLPDPAEVEQEAASEIVAAIGTKNADKVRDAALARIAAAQAGKRILAQVNSATTSARWSAVCSHGDELVSAFREALADDLATLTRCAPLVPLATTATSTALSTTAYAARFEGEEVAARVEKVAHLVAAIRGLPTGNVAARRFLVRLPDRLSGDAALAMALGFEGRRYGVQAGGTGIIQNPALWWVAVAAAGGEFALVDADEVRETGARMDAARRANIGRAETERAGLVL